MNSEDEVKMCDHCDDYYLHKSGIHEHVYSHPIKWVCWECLNYFFAKKNLVKHMYSLHDIKPHEIIYQLANERNMLASKKV